MQNHVMLMRKFKHFSKTLKFHESIIITVLSLVITWNQKLSYVRLCLKVPCGYCERKLRGQTVVNCCSFCDSSALCCVRKKSIRREGIWEKKKPDWGEHARSLAVWISLRNYEKKQIKVENWRFLCFLMFESENAFKVIHGGSLAGKLIELFGIMKFVNLLGFNVCRKFDRLTIKIDY